MLPVAVLVRRCRTPLGPQRPIMNGYLVPAYLSMMAPLWKLDSVRVALPELASANLGVGLPTSVVVVALAAVSVMNLVVTKVTASSTAALLMG